MAPNKHMIAVFNIFLLLSVDPLNAARIASISTTVDEVSHLEKSLRNLEDALREDMQEEAEATVQGFSHNATGSGSEGKSWRAAVAVVEHEAANGEAHNDTVGASAWRLGGGESLCGKKWLMVSFVENGKEHRIRYANWDNRVLFQKVLKQPLGLAQPRCKKVYTGVCQEGGVRVDTICAGGYHLGQWLPTVQKQTKTSVRDLSGFISSRDSSIGKGEMVTMQFLDQDERTVDVELTKGTVDYKIVDIQDQQNSCDDNENTFVRSFAAMQKHFTEEQPKLGVLDATHVVFNLRAATKAMSAAKRENCEWVANKASIDKDGMMKMVQRTMGHNRCFEQAKKALQTKRTEGRDEQTMALRTAMEMLMTETCDGGHDVGDEIESLDKEIDAESVKLADAAESMHDETNSSGSPALLEAGEYDLSTSVLEMAKQARVGSLGELGDFGEILVKVFGFIILAILWALFCWVIMAVVMALLGVILCSLKAVIVSLVNLFKKNKWEIAWTGCVGWWLAALGHNGGSEPEVGLCAASMMMGMVPR